MCFILLAILSLASAKSPCPIFRAVSVCRTGFDPNPPAVHFARLSFEFGEKGGGVSGVFRNGGFGIRYLYCIYILPVQG